MREKERVRAGMHPTREGEKCVGKECRRGTRKALQHRDLKRDAGEKKKSACHQVSSTGKEKAEKKRHCCSLVF